MLKIREIVITVYVLNGGGETGRLSCNFETCALSLNTMKHSCESSCFDDAKRSATTIAVS
jgi:hypothetical protein